MYVCMYMKINIFLKGITYPKRFSNFSLTCIIISISMF